MTLQMAAQLSTGEVIHLPPLLKVDRKGGVITLFTEPVDISDKDIVMTHVFLMDRRHQLLSKRPFSYRRDDGQVLQVRLSVNPNV